MAQLEPPADLWERIRRGFAMPNLDSDLVRQQEQWYVSRPDYMQRMTERSRKYLFHIVEELERRNMPTELALLPFIESAFNPQAVSSARAAGMWQFMPATGQLLRTQAERRSATTGATCWPPPARRWTTCKSCTACSATGTWRWPPTTGAKAASAGRSRATRKAAWAPRYADLNMPNETRYYVPKLQAVKNIVANPDSFRTELPLIENHPYFQSVTVAARHRRGTRGPAGRRVGRTTSRRSIRR